MTADEIFAAIASHFAKGLLVHNQLACAYGFLNLNGYRRCHEYHYYEESHNYRNFKNYYTEHFNKLIQEEILEPPKIIPANWFKHIKSDVDINTKRSAIKDLMKAWIEWETETKAFLETKYKQLYELNEICAALELTIYLRDVDEELKDAQEQQINLESENYDMSEIIAEQKSLQKEYDKKIKNVYRDDEK